MNIEELKNVNLTEKDFDLMVEALDYLPNAKIATDLIGMLITSVIDDPEAKTKMQAEREQKRKKTEYEKKLLTEEVRLLQGKLIAVKRFMRENRLMKEVNDLLK